MVGNTKNNKSVPPEDSTEGGARSNPALQAVLHHQQERFEELRCLLQKDESVHVTIAGEDGHHNLGTGIAKDAWDSKKDWEEMQENLTELVNDLLKEFPTRVQLGKVGKDYSATHLHVWGANAYNWNLPDGTVRRYGFGDGQASYFKKQEPGVFGIVTMPIEAEEEKKLKKKNYTRKQTKSHAHAPSRMSRRSLPMT
jgi:hypothetical protein